MTEAQKWIDWELIPGGFREDREASLTMHRTKVPGGWLVYIYGSHFSPRTRSDWGHGGLTFYPDPEHKWDGSSLP